MEVVESWFGAGFSRLDPQLQQLHRTGGVLKGQVEVAYGNGLAGWLGRRVAARLGLPSAPGMVPLQVQIYSRDGRLHWVRKFSSGPEIESIFSPVGAWPDGFWLESIGPFELQLRVDTTDGGWCWQQVRTKFFGTALPAAVAPQLHASKQARDERYRFAVTVSHPWFGLLFSYGGVLAALSDPVRP